MDAEHEPISPSTFPWARTGLALGTCFALATAFALVTDAPPPREPALALASAPAPAPPPATSFDPIDAPWPSGPRSTWSSTQERDLQAEAGDSAWAQQAAVRFFDEALTPCAPTRLSVGKSVSIICESARDESRAIVLAREGGTWLRTSRTKFTAPEHRSALVGRMPASENASCGWTLRFVALPADSSLVSRGGGTDHGHCTFDVEGPPARTWATLLVNVFRAGTTVHKRELDDGDVTRWTAEGWDGGWWRIDVVSESGSQERVRATLQRWAPDEEQWTPPLAFEQKIAALEPCWEPCALALRSPARELGPAARAHLRAVAVLDRCLFECKGVERAPAVIEAAARAFPSSVQARFDDINAFRKR